MHKSRLAGVIIDCNTTDLQGAADFWGAALRMELRQLSGEQASKYVRLIDPEDRFDVDVQKVTHPSRVHLDIGTDDVEAEVQRLEALGARRVEQVHSWWVMEAPTGQRFCVVRTPPRGNVLERWHRIFETRDMAALDDLLAEDAVFQSPAVHAPQVGKAITAKYLEAACRVLGNEHFRYTGEWHGERSAILEFEAKLGEVELNGVDMIWWNEEQRITRFKVMARPIKALQTLIPLMARELGG